MSIRIKKKSRLYKLIEEPALIDLIVLGFLGADYTNLLLLDKIIYHTVKGRIRYHINQTVKSFSHQYRAYFDIISKPQPFKHVLTQKGQLKLVIPIYFSIKKLLKQYQYAISYSYEVTRKHKPDKQSNKNKTKNKQYAWNCQFVVTKQNSRVIWLYKQNYSYADMSSYLMDVTPVCVDDILCFLCPFYTSGHPIQNLNFYPLTVRPYDQIASRCQIQAMYPWADYNCKKSLDFQIQDLVKSYPELVAKSIKEYSLQNFYRIEMECIKQCRNIQLLDSVVSILPANRRITCQLKKKGCYSDVQNYFELRCGDVLIIYLLKS